jgi:hypothetical protein
MPASVIGLAGLPEERAQAEVAVGHIDAVKSAATRQGLQRHQPPRWAAGWPAHALAMVMLSYLAISAIAT